MSGVTTPGASRLQASQLQERSATMQRLHSLLPANYAPPAPRTTRGHQSTPGRMRLKTPTSRGTWERRSLDTLLSIRSRNQDLGKAMYCLAKWTRGPWEIPADRWMWRVTLRPQQREAPSNYMGPTPPRPTTLQLCPYMVAARLVALMWPGPDTPTQNYPHLTEEDMPGIQRCFFSTLDYLQQTHAHILELRWTPADNPLTRTADTTPPRRRAHMIPHKAAAPARTQDTRGSVRTHPMPKPAPSSSLLTGPSIQRPPPPPGTPCRPPQPLPPPATSKPPQPQPPHPPPTRPRPAHHPESREESLLNGPSIPTPTASTLAAANAHAPAKPAPTAREKPETAAKQPTKPVGARRPQPAAKSKPKPKSGARTTARARPPEDVLYDLRPQPSQTQQQQRPARHPPTFTDAAATTFMAECAATEARRTSSHHPSNPALQAHGPARTRPEQR